MLSLSLSFFLVCVSLSLSVFLSCSHPWPSCCWKELEKWPLHCITGFESIMQWITTALHYRLVSEVLTQCEECRGKSLALSLCLRSTIRTSWITLPDSVLGELISVISTPPITPNILWGFNKRNFQEITPLFQRFRRGVGGKGLATNCAQNTAKIVPLRIVFSYSYGGHRKKGTEKRPESIVWEGFPCTNPPLSTNPFLKPLIVFEFLTQCQKMQGQSLSLSLFIYQKYFCHSDFGNR